jgi:hypothetical protein
VLLSPLYGRWPAIGLVLAGLVAVIAAQDNTKAHGDALTNNNNNNNNNNKDCVRDGLRQRAARHAPP